MGWENEAFEENVYLRRRVESLKRLCRKWKKRAQQNESVVRKVLKMKMGGG